MSHPETRTMRSSGFGELEAAIALARTRRFRLAARGLHAPSRSTPNSSVSGDL
jgi:hypothetical protein